MSTLVERLRTYQENISGDMIPIYETPDVCIEAADRIEELEKDRNAFLAKELEAVAKWSADGIYRYIHQLTDDQFCQKCVRGQCTGDAGGVCCDNSPVPDWSEHGFVEEKR